MKHRNQGFTLLELLLVVLVITLVMALTYPALSRGTTSLHLRTAGRDVLNVFRYAREKAVTEQVRMKVMVDPSARQLNMTNELGEGARSYTLPKDVKIEGVSFAGEAVLDGPVTIRFLPNGSAENAEVILRSDNGGLLKVITDPVTGGARIERPAERNGR